MAEAHGRKRMRVHVAKGDTDSDIQSGSISELIK